MYEVEVKVRAPHSPLRSRLAKLGADPIGAVTQADTYYDAPHRSFAETDEAVRIRRETPVREDGSGNDATVLTYKGPLVESASKTRVEREVDVEDGEAMAAILQALGFEPVATVEKDRERFSLEGMTVTLDSVAGLGEFVEAETEATEGERVAAREEVVSLLSRLDLDADDQLRTSYLELLLAEEHSSQL
ncbi:class IV adenylate cyclase [Natronorarus salvus]|uniref:class IV adenylate cyclase n=1 Tax=Natronorarus salvus TaxID=3117733 RepID=UPI002F26760F